MSWLCFDFASPGDNDVYIKNNEMCFRSSDSINSRKSIDSHVNSYDVSNIWGGQDVANSKFYCMETSIEAGDNSSESACLIETKNDEKSDNAIGEMSRDQNVLHDSAIENNVEILKNEAQDKSCKSSDSRDDSKLGITSNDIDGSADEFRLLAQYSRFTLLRKERVQKISSKIVPYQQNIPVQSPDNIHLFECLLLIGLNIDVSENLVPYIKMKYPANTKVPHCIEHLCFPDIHVWSNKTEIDTTEDNLNFSNRFYTITVTTEDGQRKYMYCIRVRPEGESALLPLSYCLLSSHKANEFYFKILEEVEARHGETQEEFFSFVRKLYDNRFPILGAGILVHPSSKEPASEIFTNRSTLIIKRSLDSNLARTLEYMEINLFLSIFSNVLLERKIILLSSSVSKLSFCIEGLQTALLPFEWQHVLITIVPSNMISINDLCEAPTPYLIGLLKPTDNIEILPNMKNIQQVIVVDIDNQKILKKVGDEQSILPKHLIMSLKNSLKMIHTFEIQMKNLLACETFARLFAELLKNYRRFIIRDDLDQRLKIHKEAFLRSTETHSIRIFLERFVETASFSAFVETHGYSTESKKLFKEHLLKYEHKQILEHTKNSNMLKIFEPTTKHDR